MSSLSGMYQNTHYPLENNSSYSTPRIARGKRVKRIGKGMRINKRGKMAKGKRVASGRCKR